METEQTGFTPPPNPRDHHSEAKNKETNRSFHSGSEQDHLSMETEDGAQTAHARAVSRLQDTFCKACSLYRYLTAQNLAPGKEY